MSRIKIEDLSKDEKISEAELKGIRGGSLTGNDMDSFRIDIVNEQGLHWTGRARKFSLRDGLNPDFK